MTTWAPDGDLQTFLTDDRVRRDYLHRVDEKVGDHGWVVQVVEDDVPFGYTIGLTGRVDPNDRNEPLEHELLIAGPPPPACQAILNRVANLTVETGPLPLAELLEVTVGDETVTVMLLPADDTRLAAVGMLPFVATAYAEAYQGWGPDLGSVPVRWVALRFEGWPWERPWTLPGMRHRMPVLCAREAIPS